MPKRVEDMRRERQRNKEKVKEDFYFDDFHTFIRKEYKQLLETERAMEELKLKAEMQKAEKEKAKEEKAKEKDATKIKDKTEEVKSDKKIAQTEVE